MERGYSSLNPRVIVDCSVHAFIVSVQGFTTDRTIRTLPTGDSLALVLLLVDELNKLNVRK